MIALLQCKNSSGKMQMRPDRQVIGGDPRQRAVMHLYPTNEIAAVGHDTIKGE